MNDESKDWISVDDRLPTDGGKYQVKLQRGSASITIEETVSLFFKRKYHSYWGAQGDWSYVTHWKHIKEETK